MKHVSVKIVVALILGLFISGVSAQDFGDHSSSTLTTKAWGELGQGNNDMAIKYVDKCIELYMEQAKKMQSELKDYVSADNSEKVSSYWALNDVGTCLFIKGQALIKKGDKKGAVAVFKQLTDALKYAQCWDDNGWFWKPTEAAKKMIVEMNFDAE